MIYNNIEYCKGDGTAWRGRCEICHSVTVVREYVHKTACIFVCRDCEGYHC